MSALHGNADSIRHEISRIKTHRPQRLGREELSSRPRLFNQTSRHSNVHAPIQQRLRGNRRKTPGAHPLAPLGEHPPGKPHKPASTEHSLTPSASGQIHVLEQRLGVRGDALGDPGLRPGEALPQPLQREGDPERGAHVLRRGAAGAAQQAHGLLARDLRADVPVLEAR